MATIGNDPNGYKRILFVSNSGMRKTIYIGKATKQQAESFKARVESLIAQSYIGEVDPNLAKWLSELPDTLHAKLSRAGLVKSRDHQSMPLGTFLDQCFAAFVVKQSTATTYQQTKRCLTDYFGTDKPLREITAADADKWRQWLKSERKADSTVSRRVKTARQVFKKAVKWKLIAENPFADVIAGSQSNKARQFFVTRETIGKVIDACPDREWKLLIALSRYGGLRCPSEHLALKWSDVNWERNRLRVPSCKTEHLEGGDCRFIPLFPELQKHLQDVWDSIPEGTKADYVITRYRDTNANLRTQLKRIIKRAGVQPWPKLFHNLRSTRQTELAETYPIHVVCAWLGNSRAVAQEHYLQVTDSHFTQASAKPKPTQGNTPNDTATCESSRTEQKPDANLKQKSPVLPGLSTQFHSVQQLRMTPTGFEPVSRP